MGKHFLFDELVEVYENQIAAAFERTTGRDYFAQELSALSFWLVMNKDKGVLDWEGFNHLLTAWRFNLETVDDFKKEFNSLLMQRHMGNRELSKNSDDNVFRFDLARQIFLERGL